MANVCTFKLYFPRGQGIKVLSLIAKKCASYEYLLPNLYKKHVGYEGAIVLKPKPGVYLDEYVAVLDYTSLYPSSMISDNLSHDTIVEDKKWQGEYGKLLLEKQGYEVVDVDYDIYEYKRVGNRKNPERVNTGKKQICRFVQPKKGPDGKVLDKDRGIIPQILIYLLQARKDTRKKIKYKTITTNSG